MKKILCGFIAFIIAISSLPLNAFAYYEDYDVPPESAFGSYYNYDWSYNAATKTLTFSDNGNEKSDPIDKPNFLKDDYEDDGEEERAWEADYDWRPAYPWFASDKYSRFTEKVVFDSSVTEILDYHLIHFSEVTEITISSSIKIIGDKVFEYCYKLKNIYFYGAPESVGEDILEETEFYNDNSNWDNGCLYLGSVLVRCGGGMYSSVKNDTLIVKPGTVVIADSALRGCGRKTVVLPESLRYIGKKAFCGSKVENVELPSSVEEIKDYTFSNCYNMSELNIPAGIKKIGCDIVYGSSQLTSINVDEDNDYFFSKNGVLYNRDKTELIAYPAGKTRESFTVPSYVKTLRTLFSDSKNLRIVIVPKTVERIVATSFNRGVYKTKLYYMGTREEFDSIYEGVKVKKSFVKCCRIKTRFQTEDYVYNGKTQKPVVKVYDPSGIKLKKDKDYKIISSKMSKDVGYYTIKVKLKGKYKGKFIIKYTIYPKGAELKKPKVKGTTATVSWKPLSKNITGYQIAMGRKRININSKKKTSYVIKGLSWASEYSVSIRTYKKVKGGKTVYSKWSKSRSFKTSLPK